MKFEAFLRKILGVQKRMDKLEKQLAVLGSELNGYYEIIKSRSPVDSTRSNIIVPFLSGGVGNQMFQIACAYALSKQFNYSFGINYSLYASVGQGQHPKKYQNTLYANIKSTDIVPEFQYSRLTHDFKEIKTLPPATDVQLEGFFQSRKYFGSYDEEIRQLYKLPQEDIETAETFISKDTRPVVGVHVRLGDYSDHPGLQAFKKSYFSRAASKFSPDSRIVVCSDQPDLACKILTEEKSWFRRPIRPEIYPGTSELADLAFLSSCKQLILSNSTFSYWAYFLGKKKTRVIAPKRWFNRNVNTRNHDHIYEKDWELL